MDITKLLNFPAELRRLPNWVVWKYEDIQGAKPTKVPYNPRTGNHADTSNSQTWVTFETACAYLQPDDNGNPSRYDGVGYVFQATNNTEDYIGIDLDHSDDPQIQARQIKVFEAMDSYAEVSPSGKGLHIIVKGKIPSGRRRACIEMYGDVRFFTVTGDIYPRDQWAKPIANRQELIDILWNQLGGTKKTQTLVSNYDEPHTDDEITRQALNAANGDKFQKLIEGNWRDLYGSQSEADFAYCDIVAFYTDSPNQITRMFRNSALGQREKAQRSDYVQYMLNRVFDRKFPPVDIEANNAVIEEYLARKRNAIKDAKVLPKPSIDLGILEKDAKDVAPELPTDIPNSPYTVPPGLLGELAQFIYVQSPRPVPEIALAGAIAFMAGLTGRAFNISGTGLNQYVLLLAPTGTGKEAVASAVSHLIGEIEKKCPTIRQFDGPGDFASGQALLKYISKTSPCFLSILGEFGLKMQQLSLSRTNPADLMLKKVLLDLYNKSGAKKTLNPAIYANRENNTEMIFAPSVSIFAESTPETFFASVDERMIADGLLPRFTLIEYQGKRVPNNKSHASAMPSRQLVENVTALAETALKYMQSRVVQNVSIDAEAEILLDSIDVYADKMINDTNAETTKHLWNRAHIKVLKLAALVAVGCNFIHPVVTSETVRWARAIIEYDIHRLQAKFEAGEIGHDNHETKQVAEVTRIIRKYILSDEAWAIKRRSTAQMHRDKVIPYATINQQLASIAVFQRDRQGATVAIKRAIRTMIESGTIVEVGKLELIKRYNTSQTVYSIVDASILL